MDIHELMQDVAERLRESELAHRKLLRERDLIARAARDAGLTWEEIQAALELSPRGLRLVLERTE